MQGGNQSVRLVQLAVTLAVAVMPVALVSACFELLGIAPAFASNRSDSAAYQTDPIAGGGLYA